MLALGEAPTTATATGLAVTEVAALAAAEALAAVGTDVALQALRHEGQAARVEPMTYYRWR